MKKFITVLIVLFYVSSYLKAQTYRKSSLLLLKEKHEIDSLFDYVIKESHSKNIYFSFATVANVNGYTFLIGQLLSYKDKISYSFMLPQYMKDFGYFKYRGRIIFVSGGINPYHFFIKTNKHRSFKFIKQQSNDDNKFSNLFFNTFEYRDGKFNISMRALE